jgi:uncharacterized repeat protein (TIGR03806 family)
MTRMALALAVLAGCTTEVVPPDGGPTTRPPVQTCRFDGTAPGTVPEIALESEGAIEPGLVAWDEIDGVSVAATSDRVLDPTAVLLDLSSRGTIADVAISRGAESLFVLYEPIAGRLRLSRFAMAAPIDVASERILLEVRTSFGGSIAFATDGLLYVALGDADESVAQDRSDSRGKVLRIDVSTIDATGTYAHPPDNPYSDGAGGRTAVYALGLRSPRSCEVGDDGALWCVDRNELFDEVHRIEARSNLGWPVLDGRSCRMATGTCNPLDYDLPRAARPTEGDCRIVAGAIDTRGVAPLDRIYVYSTSCGEVRGFLTRLGVTGFGMDRQIGERAGVNLVVRRADGAVRVVAGAAIERVEPSDPRPFPERLSESGCFDDVSTALPGPDLLPYDVRTALWSDGSVKSRYLVVPPAERIALARDGSWDLPVGSMALKVFAYEPPDGGAARPLEARVIVRGRYGWHYHTYAWTEDGSDALLMGAGEERELTANVGGAPREVTHYVPDRYGCAVCHGFEPAGLLGVRTDQLNDRTGSDSLARLERAGLFREPLPAREALPSIVSPTDGSASLESRARSYLHSNCGHCHRPGGWVPAGLGMDLRIETPLSDAGLCGVRAMTGTLGLYRVAPGNPGDSLVVRRMSTRDLDQMPPIATSIVDETGLSVVRQWIASIRACP